jgi:carbonic anhydrase/acetyltransferase-like protein (isoleucine patch superfamily)
VSFQDQISGFLSIVPQIHPTAYIAPNAYLVGNVEVGQNASIWPFASLRGDIASIQIGAHSNIQDGAIVHVADNLPASIGQWVTVGHRAIVHACKIENEVLVGMGSIILDGAQVGTRSLIGAGSMITGGTIIPPGSLVLGSPAQVRRSLTKEEQAELRVWAERYVVLSREYLHRTGTKKF